MQLEEAAVNFKKAAKVLLKKATDVKKPLGYTAYLRAVIQGNSEQATHLRSTKTYMVDASQAMQDLIDMAGRGKYEDETVTKPIDEAMASMNVASYMKVSGGPQARPRTMLPFNQWEETDDDAEVEVAQMLRTGVQSDHTVPSFREENGADTEQRDQLAAMGVGFQPKRENGYFDPQMTEGGWNKFMRRVKSKAKKGELGSFLKSPEGKAGRAKAKHGRDQDARLKKRGYKVGPMDDANIPSASILSEKRKLHPSMKKYTNSPEFKAHVGDSDDSEPPYHKGKGIQKKEDAPVGAAILREGSAGKKRLRRRVKAKVKAAKAGKIGDEEMISDNPKVYAKNAARRKRVAARDSV